MYNYLLTELINQKEIFEDLKFLDELEKLLNSLNLDYKNFEYIEFTKFKKEKRVQVEICFKNFEGYLCCYYHLEGE